MNVLDIAPVRIAGWKEADDRVTVVRPPPGRRGLRRIVDQLLHLMSASRIRLDPVGSAVWRAMDGERTVTELASALREQFGDQVEPAEERVGHLVRVLRRERLVGYRGWDDEAIEAWARAEER